MPDPLDQARQEVAQNPMPADPTHARAQQAALRRAIFYHAQRLQAEGQARGSGMERSGIGHW
jgi:hypothetical protein